MANEVVKKATGLLVENNEWKCSYEVEGGDIVKLTETSVKTFFNANEIPQIEIRKFIALCNFNKLNPYLNECYLIPFEKKGKDGKAVKTAQIVVSRGGYLKRAESNPNFNGMESGIILLRDSKVIEEVGTFHLDNDILLGGWAKVYHKGHSYPTTVRVAFKEYNKNNNLWNTLPAQMINKVAESQALRKAFPSQLNGLYTKEEVECTAFEEVEKEQKQNSKVIKMPTDEPVAEKEQTTETTTPKVEVKQTAKVDELAFEE